MKAPSVLITGARGYLGGRLVRHLLGRGYDVVGASRNLIQPPMGWPSAAELIRLDPTDDPAVSQGALHGIDTVVHLAAANEVRSAADPDAAMFETTSGTRRVLEAAIAAGVSRFVFLSTMHVYGRLQGEITEATAVAATHPYAISHLAGEGFVRAAHAAGRIEGAVVRLSNAIGAPAWMEVDRWTLVGNDLMRQAIETGALSLKSPGQWRDFITMRDCCVGIERLVDVAADKLGDGIFNLGGDMPLRIIDIAMRTAAAAEAILGRPVPIGGAGDASPTSQPPFYFRIDRMRALGFEPSGTSALDDELLATARLIAAERGTIAGFA